MIRQAISPRLAIRILSNKAALSRARALGRFFARVGARVSAPAERACFFLGLALGPIVP
jgi:hypothetical protein